MHYRVAEISQILNAEGALNLPETEIHNYLYDSRRLRAVEHTLFIAISGHHHNGHDYIAELFDKGLRNFLVEEVPESLRGKANFIMVDNTLRAFQKLARYTRSQSKARVVAITGSNGKTMVKEWLSQILGQLAKTTKTPKSYNSQLGVPLSVLQLEGNEAFGVFEAGISQPGEMAYLEDILKPDYGIFTNIGSAHQEYFETLQEKVQEKLQLFSKVGSLVYCADHRSVAEGIQRFEFAAHPQLWSWSLEFKPAFMQYRFDRDTKKLSFEWKGKEWQVELPFEDHASLENTLHILTLLLALEFPVQSFWEPMKNLEPISMRLESKMGRWNTVLVNDAYNSDLESLRIALEYFAQQLKSRSRVLVLSDVLETGMPKEDLYLKIAQILKDYRLEEVFTIGRDSTVLSDYYTGRLHHFNTTDEFLRQVKPEAFEGKGILLKGARSFEFERVDRYFAEKSHETVLEVNLSRLVDNFNYYRSLLKEGVKTMAMVKAFGYGAGSYEISSLLQFHKVDYLAVAYADEGVALRKAGIEIPILVLNTELSAFDDMLDFNLEPEVYSFRVLEALAEHFKLSGSAEILRIHLKLETGMHRLGFEEDELDTLIQKLRSYEGLVVQSAMSHLAASDDPSQREYTLQQIARFQKMTERLKSGLGYSFDRHTLNSSGISNFPEAQFEMVRLGIGLYGVAGSADEAPFLKPISSLKATVSQLKFLKQGDTLGYGRSYTAPEDQHIAVISIGYADGFRRSLSNGAGEVAIEGKRYPVVGKVCMDMAMVNVSEGLVQEGAEVEVFGQHISLEELSRKMETIPYEVLASISQRVKRVYLME